MQIENTSAVVTGAAGGIGLAVAHALIARQVGQVAVVDQSAQCHQAAEQLNRQAGRTVALAMQGDVTQADFRRQVFDRMQQQAPVQICVPAAGILRDALAAKINRQTGRAELYCADTFRRVLEVNLLHPVYWALQTLAGIAEQRHRAGQEKWQPEEGIQASIVLIGSVSCRGNRGQVSYSSAKAGLAAAGKTLNLEGLYHGVQTRIIHPGFVATPMFEQLPADHFEQKLKPLVPLGRLIQPAEIAAAVVALIENPVLSGPLWADAGLAPMA